MIERAPTLEGGSSYAGGWHGLTQRLEVRVLTVDQREAIRRAYFLEGKSIRQIAREKHHDRCTIRRALNDAGPAPVHPAGATSQANPRPVHSRHRPLARGRPAAADQAAPHRPPGVRTLCLR